MSVDALVAEVERRFQEFVPVSWPDPHVDPPSANEAIDPRRYEIVWQRTQAWVAACTMLLDATWQSAPDLGRPRAEGCYLMRLASSRPDTLAIVVECPAEDVPEQGVLLAIEDADGLFQHGPIPYCLCEGCDEGSRELLNEVDVMFLPVVTGALVRLESGLWDATRWGDDSYFSRLGGTIPDEEIGVLLDALSRYEAPALPAGIAVRRGRSWFAT